MLSHFYSHNDNTSQTRVRYDLYLYNLINKNMNNIEYMY